MLKNLLNIKYYIAGAAFLVGVFLWAGFTGTRLLGNDTETIEDPSGPGSHSGRSGRHGSRGYFYHK